MLIRYSSEGDVSALSSLEKRQRQSSRKMEPRQGMKGDARRPGGWPFTRGGGWRFGSETEEGPKQAHRLPSAPLRPPRHLSAGLRTCNAQVTESTAPWSAFPSWILHAALKTYSQTANFMSPWDSMME